MNRNVIIYAGITAVVMFSGCAKQDNNIYIGSSAQVIDNFNVSETTKGIPNWVLNAQSAEIFESENKILLDRPHIRFFENGKESSTLVAAKGRINTQNYNIYGESGCVLNTKKGDRLSSETLYYRSDIKKVLSDDDIVLERPSETIYGKGLEATPDLESVIIKNQRVLLSDGATGYSTLK